MRRIAVAPLWAPTLLALPLLAACEEMAPAAAEAPPSEAAVASAAVPEARPAPAPAPREVAPTTVSAPAGAATVEALDTTTEEERDAALVQPEAAPAGSLGTTTATLGPPGDPGIWVETPLVTSVQQGRVTLADTGQTVTVELRPSGGEPGSGSQISLAAIRALDAPLTGILELEVFSG